MSSAIAIPQCGPPWPPRRNLGLVRGSSTTVREGAQLVVVPSSAQPEAIKPIQELQHSSMARSGPRAIVRPDRKAKDFRKLSDVGSYTQRSVMKSVPPGPWNIQHLLIAQTNRAHYACECRDYFPQSPAWPTPLHPNHSSSEFSTARRP